jgi:hypothetical protein
MAADYTAKTRAKIKNLMLNTILFTLSNNSRIGASNPPFDPEARR